MTNDDHHDHQHDAHTSPPEPQPVDHAHVDHTGHTMPAAQTDAHAGHAMPTEQHGAHAGHADHSEHAEVFKHRFWISLLLSIPVVLYSEMVQDWLGFSMPD